jgi:hypothetical protein
VKRCGYCGRIIWPISEYYESNGNYFHSRKNNPYSGCFFEFTAPQCVCIIEYQMLSEQAKRKHEIAPNYYNVMTNIYFFVGSLLGISCLYLAVDFSSQILLGIGIIIFLTMIPMICLFISIPLIIKFVKKVKSGISHSSTVTPELQIMDLDS